VAGVSTSLPDDIRTGEFLVTALTRFVLIGADGTRLHEEVLLAARAVPLSGRSRRVELDARRFEVLRETVEAALEPNACLPADPAMSRRLAELWPELRELLAADVLARAEVRQSALERDLASRKSEELDRSNAITEHMRYSLSDALGEPLPRQLRLDELDQPEQRQLEMDRDAWRARLDSLDDEQRNERAVIERRYLGVRTLTFPVAVLLVTPSGKP
jgi:hypothetical protein